MSSLLVVQKREAIQAVVWPEKKPQKTDGQGNPRETKLISLPTYVSG